MTPKLLLRIASGAMIFHFFGHSVGNLKWKQATDPVKLQVIREMTSHEFPFMGTSHSIGDYYSGFGYLVSVAIVFFAAILWLISGAIKESPALAYRLLVTTMICLFAFCIVEFVFFFPLAAGTTLLAAILSLVTIMQLKNQGA